MSVLKLLGQINIGTKNSSNPDHAAIPITYNNSNFQFQGRWNDTGSGIWTGWNGSRIIFKVRGTGILTIIASVIDAESTTLTGIGASIDNSADCQLYTFTEQSEIFTGIRSINIPIPNDNRIHTVELYTPMYGPSCFLTTQKVTITTLLTGSLAILSSWTQPSTRIQCIGDSWCANITSWIRLMDITRWQLYPISNASYKISDMDSGYNFDFTGQTNTTDPVCNGIIISSGVNDWGAGVTVANFQTSLLSLIDKIQIKQPGKPIFLVRVPNNGANLFGQYGTAMSNAVGLRTNISYIDTTTLDTSMVFLSDNSHLNGSSKVVFARFVSNALISAGL